jgi:hypothetical protein
MAVANGYGKTVTSGSVFMYDMGDIVNSYRGEPTTNDYGYNFRDFTGTGYSPYGQWSETTVTKTYLPNLNTPIGPGGTLMVESTTSGWQGLSRYGGGSESGAHTLSAFIYPLTNNINNFTIGLLGDGGNMIFFDLTTNTITYGAGISNGNGIIQPVNGYPGWFRVGANFEGRFGGWVGSIGYNMYQQYGGTGTLRSMYITGIQYEYKTHVTPFTPSSRSATQGLLPLVGNSSIDLSNVSFDSNAQMTFDGTNDYVPITLSTSIGVYCLEMVWYNNNAIPNNDTVIGGPTTYQTPIEFNGNGSGVHLGAWTGGMTNEAIHIWGGGGATSNRVAAAVGYHHVVFNWNGTTYDIWVDGVNTTTYYQNGTTPAGLITATSIKLGRDVDNYCFNGQIPVTRIYNRALSSAEVKQNYNKYKSRFNLP